MPRRSAPASQGAECWRQGLQANLGARPHDAGAPLPLRGGERAPDHGQEAIGAQELGPQADEATRAEAGARRGGAQARHPLGTDLER